MSLRIVANPFIWDWLVMCSYFLGFLMFGRLYCKLLEYFDFIFQILHVAVSPFPSLLYSLLILSQICANQDLPQTWANLYTNCLLKKKNIFFQTFSFCLVCATTFVSSLTGWMVSIFSLSFPFFWRMFESGEEFHKISTDFWRASLDLLQFTRVLLEGNPNVKWCFCLWKFAIIW